MTQATEVKKKSVFVRIQNEMTDGSTHTIEMELQNASIEIDQGPADSAGIGAYARVEGTVVYRSSLSGPHKK